MTKNILEPNLSSKKEYTSKEGHPKTEYVWRHPPVFETASGQIRPIYIGARLGDLSGSYANPAAQQYSNEVDDEEANFGAVRASAQGEESLLFRDSGYGHGMLPGLKEKTPLAGMSDEPRFIPEDFEVIQLGNVVGEDERKGKAVDRGADGEVTKALRRIREKRGSGAGSATSTVRPARNSIEAVERGMAGSNMRD